MPDNNQEFWTKVDDSRGLRLVQKLRKAPNSDLLWSGNIYVYYTPTHYWEGPGDPPESKI